MRNGMDSVFGLHHVAHAHNAETGADSLAGMDARSMKKAGGSGGSSPRPSMKKASG
jgi:enoyl-CoA hydratase